ncbi:MAG: T9SS type A sorting domain-containing protein [Bacteroidales bacterium]|nr:T9SS type A sorting domain-containing protein [Bacteroidales bacterium]
MKNLFNSILLSLIFCTCIFVKPANTQNVINISNNESSSENPDIEVLQQNIYVVWEDNTTGTFLIYFSEFDGNWSTPAPVSTAVSGENPRIAVDTDNITVVWQAADGIYYSQYNNDIWSEASFIPGSTGGTFPDISVEDNKLYVVWNKENEVYFCKYDINWTEPLNISNSDGGSLSPSLFVKNNIIHVVWYEYISDDLEIMYSNNIDNSWSEPVNISNTPDWSWFPQITADEDSVYIVWEENLLTNTEIYFTGLNVPSTEGYENIKKLHTGLNNYPNPFSHSTVINYHLKFSGKLVLKIYDMLGHEVRTLVNENQSAGEHSITWNGKDTEGNKLANGIYYYRLTTGKQVNTKKMLYLR